MVPEMAEAFDTAVNTLVTDVYPEGVFELQVSGHVTWGFPLDPITNQPNKPLNQ